MPAATSSGLELRLPVVGFTAHAADARAVSSACRPISLGRAPRTARRPLVAHLASCARSAALAGPRWLDTVTGDECSTADGWAERGLPRPVDRAPVARC